MLRRYLTLFGCSFLIVLALAAAITRLADPYDYWGSPVIAGFNRWKPAAERHLDATKHAQYLRALPRTLIAGNSRVEVGIDPASAAWPAAMRPVYNFGQPGIGLRDNVTAAIAAAEAHRPAAILLGIDVLDFRITREDWHTPYAPPAPTRYSMPWSERWSMLVSLDALEDAAQTVAAQHETPPRTMTPLGSKGPGELQQTVGAEGHAALFAQRSADYVGRFLDQPKRLAWPEPGANANWAALDRLAAYCAERGIALRVFTYPYHQDLLLAFARTGLGSDVRLWRRTLAAWSGAHGVPVQDFMTIDAATTEPVPAKGDTRPMRWYWEAGHFKTAMGDRMIAALTGGAAYGTPLTPATEPALTGALFAGIARIGPRDPSAIRIDQAFRTVRSEP